jgi:carboxyl-terminal processing protease
MNKKISVGLCLALVIIAIAATFSITMVFSKQIYNGIISNISQRSQSYENVEEINQIISNNFYGDLSSFNNSLSASLAEGYVNGLNDDNSYYMTASEYTEYSERMESGVKGIGIETAYDYTDDVLKITYVYEGSSAESEGLKAGDVITAVGNVTVTRANYFLIQSQFTGTMLGSVQIEYERDDVTKVVQPISSFTIPSVTGKTVNGVGYIRISGFYKNTADELKEMLSTYKSNSITSVVIDLRNTSEGTVKYAAKALDMIVSSINNGSIAVLKYADNSTESIASTSNNSSNMNFAVLINDGTKGPAELFACDMRDIKMAQLIGTTTAGVGTMQEIFTLSDGGAILLTTALVIPYAGEDAVYDSSAGAENKGVKPTMEVTLSVDDSNILLLSETEDTQLAAAVNMLAP